MTFDNLINRDESVKWVPAILKCECGEEWSNDKSTVKKGANLYVKSECRKCSLKREAKEGAERAEKIKARRQQEFEENLPTRYRGKLKNPINTELLDSTCSIICGAFGTGKTWESYAVTKELFNSGAIKGFKMITEVGLLNDLKADFDFMDSKIDSYKNVELLIIDESGKTNDSDFNKSQLFEILNHRYDWEKKTILLCNVSNKQELKELLPTATLDRFRECIVEMKGRSKRYE